MTMRPRLRKFVLTAHVTFAVGWLGAVIGFLALAIAGLTSQDAQMVRAVYLAMALIAQYVIVPLSFAPLLTGPVLSVFTPWDLFRHLSTNCWVGLCWLCASATSFITRLSVLSRASWSSSSMLGNTMRNAS